MESNNILVCVQCSTYNHSLYIVDAMNGFTMQDSSFQYVCCILDDASTDGEPDIIRQYLQKNFDLEDQSVVRNEETDDYVLCFAQHKTNKNCYFAVFWLKYNHYNIKKTKMPYISEWRDNAKYIAICEGDDYWIDPSKLQKQVSYMHVHPNCSLCFTGAKVIFDRNFDRVDNKEYRFLYSNLENRDYTGLELLQHWILPTASVLYRSDVVCKVDKRFMFGDIILGLSAAEFGSIHCISEKMVVYRRNFNGVSTKSKPLLQWVNHLIAIADVFGDKYKKICKNHIISCIASSLLTGDGEERKSAIIAIMESPVWIPSIFWCIIKICVKALYKRVVGLKSFF